MRVVIIGAGPVGLHAAVAALGRGHEVVVFEAHDVAHHVRQWGHVRMFTPWAALVTEEALQFVDLAVDEPTACPTGAELVSSYLEPLANRLDVRPHTAVRQVGRTTLRKGQSLGHPGRARDRFRVLVETPDGLDVETADVVFDCTGVFGDPAPAGMGGLVAPGEADARAAGQVRYGPADVRDLSGLDVALVGDGASAATVLDQLLDLGPRPHVHWVTPRHEAPGFVSDAHDPFPERQRLFHRATDALSHEAVTHYGGVGVERVHRAPDHLVVTLTDGRQLHVAQLVACTGFRPDHRLTRELQRTVSWSTEGPLPIAEALREMVGDHAAGRLVDPMLPPETVTHPEPNFFVLGHKSYGRRSDFLLLTGYRQAHAALDRLRDPGVAGDRPTDPDAVLLPADPYRGLAE